MQIHLKKQLVALVENESLLYMHSETVNLKNKIEEVSAKGHNLRVDGPPGTDKSTEAWAWALWKE